MEETYRENEIDVINPSTQMHYALLSTYARAKFPQSHDFFELCFALSGRQEIEVSGTRSSIGAGTLFIIRPGEVHTRRYLSPGQHINVAFSAEIASQLFAYLGEGFPSSRLLARPAPLCSLLSKGEADTYRRRFDALNMIPVHDAARSRTLLRILLMEIFTRDFAPAELESPAAQEDWFSRLLEEMKTPEALARGVDAMIEISGKSHEHLCRVSRQRIGLTPTAFVNDLRLTYAANRLRHSGDSIADACYAAGFENLSHFYHLFRQKYKKTPRDFRAGR